MDRAGVQRWIDAYVRAWASNDPAQVGDLFAEDARYFTHPFREPWHGRDAIVKEWTAHPDRPGSWDCHYQALAVEGDVGVVRGETTYFKEDGSIETKYANVFVIGFDHEGKATAFTEFFMKASPPPRGP